MTHWFSRFAKNEEGNAVVDWLALVAGVVLLTVSVVVALTPQATDISDDGTPHAPSVETNRPV